MKRLLLFLPGLFILLSVPYQVLAWDCEDVQVQYFLDCQNGTCEGFKVVQEYIKAACGLVRLEVIDLDLEEVEKITAYFQDIEHIAVTEEHQQYIITMFAHCAWAITTNDTRIMQACARDKERYSVELQSIQKPLPEWKKEKLEAAEAHRETQEIYRQNRHRNYQKFMVYSFVIVVLIPLGIMGIASFLSRKNQTIFTIIVLLMLALQIYILLSVAIISIFIWSFEIVGMLLLAILLEIVCFLGCQLWRNRSNKRTV